MLGRFLIYSAGVLALLCVTGIPGPLHAQHARGGSRAMHSPNFVRSPNFGRPNRGFDRGIFSDTRFGRTNGSFDRRFGGFDRGFGRFDRDFDRRFDRGFGGFDRDFDRRFDRRFFDPRFGFSPGILGFSPGFGLGGF